MMKRGMRVWFKFKNTGQWKSYIITDIWINEEKIYIRKKNGSTITFDDIEEIRTPRKVGIRGAPTYVKISDLAFLLHHQLY